MKQVGSDECIRFLNECIEIANGGKMAWVCTVMVLPGEGPEGEVACGFAGASDMTIPALNGVRAVFKQIVVKYQSRQNEADIKIRV